MSEERLLFYMHIPKTAGRSLNAIIKAQYVATEYCGHTENHHLTTRALGKLSPEQRAGLKVVAGHFCFGVHKGIGRPCTYTTLLRDPVVRVIDTYFYIQNRPSHHLHKSTRMGLLDFVQMKDYMVRNLQTRYILGTGEYLPLKTTGNIVERAIDILDRHFALVGTVDMFDESVFLLKQLFGWNDIYYVRKNVTPNCPSLEEIPEEVIDVVLENNQLDLELYRYAKNRLEKQLAQLDAATQIELSTYIQENQLFQERGETKK